MLKRTFLGVEIFTLALQKDLNMIFEVISWGVKQGDTFGPFSVFKKLLISYGNNNDSERNPKLIVLTWPWNAKKL